MFRRLFHVLAVLCIAGLISLLMLAPLKGIYSQWTTARTPPLQGPVQGDWFTDMSDATAWADEVEPPRRQDVGLFIYEREPVVSVSGPAQPAIVSSIRHRISVPFWRAVVMLCVIPAFAAGMWLMHLRRTFLRARRRRQGCCPHCGYDLRASSGRCPECGLEVALSSVATESKNSSDFGY